MTGSEWLLSLSGTGAEKKLLTVNCNWCHSYQQIFRNHYDEHGWTENRLPHDPRRRLAADQHQRARPLQRRREAKLVNGWRPCAARNSSDPGFRHAAASAGPPDPGGHHRIRTAAAGACHPRRDRRCQGQCLVLDPPQLLCGPARSAHRRGQGIPRAAGAPTACSPARIGSTSTRTTSSGARRTGRTTSGGSIPKTGAVHAHPLEGAGALELADGRQLRARSGGLHLEGARPQGQQGRGAHRRAGDRLSCSRNSPAPMAAP